MFSGRVQSRQREDKKHTLMSKAGRFTRSQETQAGQEQARSEPSRQAGKKKKNTGKTWITAENNLALSESKSEAFMQRRLANKLQVWLIGKANRS